MVPLMPVYQVMIEEDPKEGQMGSRLCFKATFLRRVDGLALGTGDR